MRLRISVTKKKVKGVTYTFIYIIISIYFLFSQLVILNLSEWIWVRVVGRNLKKRMRKKLCIFLGRLEIHQRCKRKRKKEMMIYMCKIRKQKVVKKLFNTWRMWCIDIHVQKQSISKFGKSHCLLGGLFQLYNVWWVLKESWGME